VDGELNLGRSLGDLLYKLDPNLPQEEQKVIPVPDISVTKIESNFEFIVIACDGIWDCVTSKKCTRFLYNRIEEDQSLVPAIEQLMDECIAGDLENCGGIGHDNMTCLVVYFKSS